MDFKKLLTIFVILFLEYAYGQSPEGVMIKTYPIRYLYGFNAEVTYTAPNEHQISLHVQDHLRDWFAIRSSGDMMGFSVIPNLEEADGYTAFLSYQFPIGNEQTPTFAWWGIKLGGKDVTGYAEDFSLKGEKRSIVADQQNAYLLGQITLRNQLKGFIIEAYFHAGVVNIDSQESVYDKSGDLLYERQHVNYYLPHFLMGFSVGYGF